ncbi:hypothetical protein BH10PLA1_BH10PLA1_09220 [soil metagenome]
MTLPPVSILGVGAVTPIGRDLATIADRLGLAPSPGTTGEGRGEGSSAIVESASSSQQTPHPTFSRSTGRGTEENTRRVPDEFLADPATNKRLRRADRFTRMAVIAASDAWASAQPSLAGVPMERIGLIVASGFGPHGRGFKFLDGILDHGDDAALPTDFSHSVHGAPAAYITELLGMRGPSLSVTDFVSGFEQSVQLAQCWIEQGACDRVLVGVVEELGEVLLHCAGRLLNHDQRVIPGEGAVFWMLGRAELPGLATLGAGPVPQSVDLLIRESPAIGLASPTTDSLSASQSTTFNPYFGHSPSSAAFQLLGGLLSIQARKALGKVLDVSVPVSVRVDNVATFRPSFDSSAATLLLTKKNSEPGRST